MREGISDFYPTAEITSGIGAWTPGEIEIHQSLQGSPQLPSYETQTRLARVLRTAGCDNFGTYLPGPGQGRHIELNSGDVLRDKFFHQGKWVNLHHAQSGGILRDVLLENFGVMGSWRWGSRMFRVGNLTVRNSTISSVQEEHGFYLNLSSSGDPDTPTLLFERVLFEYIGSQCLQTTLRDKETPDFEADGAPSGPIVLDGCVFRHFHMPSGTRTAHTIQIKGSQHDVHIGNCIWDNTTVPESFGALTVQGLQDRAGGATADPLYTDRKVYLNECAMFLAPTRQQPIWIDNVRKFSMLNSHIEVVGGGGGKIDLTNVGNVRIEGCTGNVSIYMNRTKVGTIEGGLAT